MAYEQIGQSFIQFYYSKFDVTDGATRSTGLAPLYDTLPIRSIQRLITKTDCQPLADGSILVTTFGQLKTDDDPPNSYLHTFVLRQTPDGTSWFIANEIFRLVIHNVG